VREFPVGTKKRSVAELALARYFNPTWLWHAHLARVFTGGTPVPPHTDLGNDAKPLTLRSHQTRPPRAFPLARNY
jgi:hypothetical protein